MRIIAGTRRSRRLRAPAGDATRPSSDKLRETLFNLLGPAITGSVFLDAYAGSGAVGLEALSRGARAAIWIESSPAALAALRANLAELAFEGTVLALPAARALARVERLPEAAAGLDFVFFDPPYEAAHEYERWLRALNQHVALLTPATVIIAECRRGAALPECAGSLARVRVHCQGDSQLVFYRLSAESQEAEPTPAALAK